jgi:hypothetical protein
MRQLPTLSNGLRVTTKWIASPVFSSVLNLVMLGVALGALIIAQRTLSESDRQFSENSFAADSLFKLQLAHSEQLNDSLVAQIRALQTITSKQIQITDQQLAVSVQTYRAQLYSGRPVIAIRANKVTNTATISPDSVSPLIETDYSNVGKRNASHFIIRTFLVYPDFSDIRSNAASQVQSQDLEPDVSMTAEFKPRILASHQANFYYCIDFRYSDDILNQSFYFAKYYHYYRSRLGYDFYSCEDGLKPRIRQTINAYMQTLRLPLFDESPKKK